MIHMSVIFEHQALRSGILHGKLAQHSFRMLRKLAENTGRVPDSYLIDRDAVYHVEEKLFASGGFADVRKGRLGKKEVAVKTIRIAPDMNVSKIRRVGAVGGSTTNIRYSCTKPGF